MANYVKRYLKIKNNGIFNFENLKYFFTLNTFNVLAIIGAFVSSCILNIFRKEKLIRKTNVMPGYLDCFNHLLMEISYFERTIIPASK